MKEDIYLKDPMLSTGHAENNTQVGLHSVSQKKQEQQWLPPLKGCKDVAASPSSSGQDLACPAAGAQYRPVGGPAPHSSRWLHRPGVPTDALKNVFWRRADI